MKLYKPRVVVETTVQMGYPESVIVGLGVALLLSTLLFLLPRTSILGAILLTGYLGGRRSFTGPCWRRAIQHRFSPYSLALYSGAGFGCGIAACRRCFLFELNNQHSLKGETL